MKYIPTSYQSDTYITNLDRKDKRQFVSDEKRSRKGKKIPAPKMFFMNMHTNFKS